MWREDERTAVVFIPSPSLSWQAASSDETTQHAYDVVSAIN